MWVCRRFVQMRARGFSAALGLACASLACGRAEPTTTPATRVQPGEATGSKSKPGELRQTPAATSSGAGTEPSVESVVGLSAAGDAAADERVTQGPSRARTDFQFTRALGGDVRSLAFGKEPRMAVLTDQPHIFDGESWTRRALPAHLSAAEAEREVVEIFFGRDNQPRLMGTRFVGDQTTAVYLRHFSTGWRKEPGELGPLARAKSLYGLLGYADPEVVCEPGAFCLVKRISGWGRVNADDEPRRLFLTDAGVYKQAEGRLWLLTGVEWTDVAPLAFEPLDLCRDAVGATWLVGGTPSRVFILEQHGAGKLAPVDVPLKDARRLHCSADGVWVAGERTLALQDAAGWWGVPSPAGEITLLAGRTAGELWVGTSEGLYQGKNVSSH